MAADWVCMKLSVKSALPLVQRIEQPDNPRDLIDEAAGGEGGLEPAVRRDQRDEAEGDIGGVADEIFASERVEMARPFSKVSMKSKT
jgi:hypothetical protein